MKQLRFTYHMELRFSEPVTDHHFTFRCLPRTDEMQEITDRQVEIAPCDWTEEGTDSFGNEYIYGVNSSSHSRLYIGVSGHAQTDMAEAITAPPFEDCGIFLMNGPLTEPGKALLEFDRALAEQGMTAVCGERTDGMPGLSGGLDQMPAEKEKLPAYLCDAVYRYMNYTPGVTHFGTSAEEAIEGRAGVCQDYSHICLSLLRLHGIPCRYVAGILLGEGKSHAWIEAWRDGRWFGYDPTNDIRVSDLHISFARGRNCMDTLVNRGVFRGTASQKMFVTATAVEVGLESYFS